jgi:hypothetical protein
VLSDNAGPATCAGAGLVLSVRSPACSCHMASQDAWLSQDAVTCAQLTPTSSPPPPPFRTWKTYKVAKGPKFALERKRQATDLTADMVAK